MIAFRIGRSSMIRQLVNVVTRQRQEQRQYSKFAELSQFMKNANDPLMQTAAPIPPYLDYSTPQKRVLIETYGCQMNFNDSEVVLGILTSSKKYIRVDSPEEADIILLMTCAIRENAEQKIWSRLDELGAFERRKKGRLTVGVLGCMAERLKSEVLERKRNVDIVCGPDAYRNLPHLLDNAMEDKHGIDVMLSVDETYADVAPVRLNAESKTAFVSIMRGCNNMCTYCIVPFTRGRERSRPISSILDEIKRLSDEGVKEVTLLGQNVNSFCDESDPRQQASEGSAAQLSRGFRTIYKQMCTNGHRFVDLLDKVSLIDPEMRIRFTSPHPKDFPDDLIYLMKERNNICKQIHLPAQSGSSTVLERMRRGYTREAYLSLVDHIRSIIPNVSLSSDFIVGFCGESEGDHSDTISLIKEVGYDMAYMYAYSMREKTTAHRRYVDDVPEDVKQRRLREVIDTFYSTQSDRVSSLLDTEQLVLVEGVSKKSGDQLKGKIDGGRTVVFPKNQNQQKKNANSFNAGDYVKVKIVDIVGNTPIGIPLSISSITDFNSTLVKGEHFEGSLSNASLVRD